MLHRQQKTRWLPSAIRIVDNGRDEYSTVFVLKCGNIFTLSYLFVRGPAPACLDAADVNDDGGIDVSDVIYLIQYNFNDGPEPPPPFPAPGPDPTADPLDCASSIWSG